MFEEVIFILNIERISCTPNLPCFSTRTLTTGTRARVTHTHTLRNKRKWLKNKYFSECLHTRAHTFPTAVRLGHFGGHGQRRNRNRNVWCFLRTIFPNGKPSAVITWLSVRTAVWRLRVVLCSLSRAYRGCGARRHGQGRIYGRLRGLRSPSTSEYLEKSIEWLRYL